MTYAVHAERQGAGARPVDDQRPVVETELAAVVAENVHTQQPPGQPSPAEHDIDVRATQRTHPQLGHGHAVTDVRAEHPG